MPRANSQSEKILVKFLLFFLEDKLSSCSLVFVKNLTKLESRKKKKRHSPQRNSLYGGVIFIAAVGHCISQAKHCMQSISRAGSDFFSEVGCPGESAQSYSETGHTSMHAPSPVHTSQSTATLVPCIPRFFGGSTGPQTLCPLCSPTTFLVF